VISLDLSSTATWAGTRRLALAQALIRCSGALPAPRLCDRRSVLPSRAITSAPAGAAFVVTG
jgi:hypothetical protein